MSISQINRQPDYSDFDLNFIANPATNDISTVKGQAAIVRSISNLLKTNYYERPFQSNIGSNVTGLLFEPTTSITSIQLEKAIRQCIELFEPRVRLDKINVSYDEDQYGFNVRLLFIILNNNLPVTTTLFLERIR